MHHAEILSSGTPAPEWVPGHRILHAIRRITRAADLYSRKLAIEHGITAPQLLVLDEVVAKGAKTVRSVADEVHLSASAWSGSSTGSKRRILRG